MVNGIPIKEGCLVAVPVYYLHYRSDCWTDPEQFDPERCGIAMHAFKTLDYSTQPILPMINIHLPHVHSTMRTIFIKHTGDFRTHHIAPYSFPFLCCRFSKYQKSSINTGAFVPFGSGPRSCIGMRLAIMEAKMTLIEVLSKFRIVKAPETKVIKHKAI